MDATRYRAEQLALFDRLAAGATGSTIVPLRVEYVGAAIGLTLIHLLPSELSTLIENQVLDPLRAFRSKHYWYPAADRHLTLKNVRIARTHAVFPRDLVEGAANAIGRVCMTTAPLDFDILGPVCLPTSIVVRAIGTLAHRQMILSLDRELFSSGVPDDKVYASNDVFIGNITVCRFTESPAAELVEAIGALRDLFVASQTVRAASLVQCDEVCSSASRVVMKEFALDASGPRPVRMHADE